MQLQRTATTRNGFFKLTLLLHDARGCRPAALALRDPRLDVFGRVETYVRAQDGNRLPTQVK
jgi:hypothetical protein